MEWRGSSDHGNSIDESPEAHRPDSRRNACRGNGSFDDSSRCSDWPVNLEASAVPDPS
jgi:hypothetical protein